VGGDVTQRRKGELVREQFGDRLSSINHG
jgi:hypothetical protein